MAKQALVLLLAVGAVLASAAVASADGVTATLFGGATAQPSAVSLTSDLTDTSTANDVSGVQFTLPAGTTFADLTRLSTEFDPTAGGCGGGSPRFSLELASGKNVFVYLGPSPNFTGCALGAWQSSGNLIGNNDTGRYDTSQVQAGTQSNTYSGALSLIGSQQVTKIDLVVDAGWFFNPKVQTVLVRNVQIDGQTFFTASRERSAEQACREELDSVGRTGFEHEWGSNHNLRNAFGKCVSSHAQQGEHHDHH